MKWIEQKDRMTCGQCCIAMIAGISVKKACEIIGHSHGTKTKELAKALRKLGFKCKNSLKIEEPEFLAIVKQSIPGTSNWHWVVFYNGNYYDAAKGINPKLWNGRKYTSLEIKKK